MGHVVRHDAPPVFYILHFNLIFSDSLSLDLSEMSSVFRQRNY